MAKQKYRGMFETQKSGNKTSSGEIGHTLASPKVGQDQVSDVVSILCWHAAPVALYELMKTSTTFFCTLKLLRKLFLGFQPIPCSCSDNLHIVLSYPTCSYLFKNV